MTVYPTLPSTVCPDPAPVPDFVGATEADRDKSFVEWLGSAEGRFFLSGEREAHWECATKLKAVHVEQLKWPAPTAK